MRVAYMYAPLLLICVTLTVSFVIKIDQYQAVNSAADTPAERESPERVSRVMSGVSEPKSGAESPTKSREAAPPAHTTSGRCL